MRKSLALVLMIGLAALAAPAPSQASMMIFGGANAATSGGNAMRTAEDGEDTAPSPSADSQIPLKIRLLIGGVVIVGALAAIFGWVHRANRRIDRARGRSI
jgi:hypothetical protein